MDAYDLLQKRIMARGSNVEERLANDKLKTLKKALMYSYQAETIEVERGVELRALLNNNKLKMDYDDKIISIPYDANVGVGTVFYWPRIKESWIVYLRHYSEDAYFRGYVRKAQHKIRWEDEYGVIHESFAAVRGPVETKIRSEQKSGNAFDVPNYTLSIILPNNEETKKLKRYSKIALDGKMWEVAVTDSISEPGVIDLQALEYYVNKGEDDKVLDPVVPPGTQLDRRVTVKTSLDNLTEIEIAEPFRLWAMAEMDGEYSEELSNQAKFSVVEGVAVITDSYLNVLEPPGKVVIRVDIPKVGYSNMITFEAKALSLPAAEQYLITGDEKVKSFGKSKYSIRYYLDGVESSVNSGEWVITPNDKLFTVVGSNQESIELKWVLGMHGTVKLKYRIGDNTIASKNIVVKSLI